jgi:hypothetical protein
MAAALGCSCTVAEGSACLHSTSDMVTFFQASLGQSDDGGLSSEESSKYYSAVSNQDDFFDVYSDTFYDVTTT